MSGERQTETHQAKWASYASRSRALAEAVARAEAAEARVAELETEYDRLKTWQKAYAKGRSGLVQQADQDFARAEALEARVAELEEQIGWTVQRCNAALGDGFQGNANSAVAAVCDRLGGVQDRIDRAVAERTAECARLVGSTSCNCRSAIEREFLVPTRTQEADR